MRFFKGNCIILLLLFMFIGCSTVKYFSPNNYERNGRQLKYIYEDSTTIIINDLRKSVNDKTKDVIEEIVMSSLNSSQSNNQKNNVIINIDIMEHRAYFSLAVWNGETILHLILSENNNGKILTDNIIKIEDSVPNIWGYKSAEEVAQKTFEKAMTEILNILEDVMLNAE